MESLKNKMIYLDVLSHHYLTQAFGHIQNLSIICIDMPHLTLHLKIHIKVFYMYKWYCTEVCVLNSINVYLVRKLRLIERKKCIEDDMVNKIRKLLIVDIFVDVSGLFF